VSVVPEARQTSVVPEARQASVVPEARQASVVPEARQASTASTGCAPPRGGISVSEGVGTQAVVRGRVTRAGTPLDTGYARLLNSGGDFVAEVALGDDGGFTFYAASGDWTLRVLAPGGARAEREVSAHPGMITEVEVEVAP
jgi:hypothetical protein